VGSHPTRSSRNDRDLAAALQSVRPHSSLGSLAITGPKNPGRSRLTTGSLTRAHPIVDWIAAPVPLCSIDLSRWLLTRWGGCESETAFAQVGDPTRNGSDPTNGLFRSGQMVVTPAGATMEADKSWPEIAQLQGGSSGARPAAMSNVSNGATP
jgi:hypothetical protein